MKLETTRGIFLAVALAVTALATAVWQEPATRIVQASDCTAAEAPCPIAPPRHRASAQAEPDANLLLLVLGLSQALKGEQ